jgi:hypothetical protein
MDKNLRGLHQERRFEQVEDFLVFFNPHHFLFSNVKMTAPDVTFIFQRINLKERLIAHMRKLSACPFIDLTVISSSSMVIAHLSITV